MKVSVILEQTSDDAYRATSFVPIPLVAEAATRQQAVERIRDMIRDKLAQVEVVQIEVPGKEVLNDPWIAMIGNWAGHPDAAEIEQNMREYREEADADANWP